MARKIEFSKALYFKSLIEKGMSIGTVAKMVPCKHETLTKAFTFYGLVINRNVSAPTQSRLNRNEIVSRYLVGESELSIANFFKVSRNVIRSILIKNRTKIRSGSEANYVRMSKLSTEQRKQIVNNANNAMRIADPTRRLSLKAISGQIESNFGKLIGPGEKEISDALADVGFWVTRQKAIHVYNIDIVFGHVAVEVKFGTHGRFGTNVSIQRFKHIAKAGLNPVVLIIRDIESLQFCLSEIITLLQVVNCKPSSLSKYWVIRSGLHSSTIKKGNFINGAGIIPPPELVTSIREVNYIIP